MALTFICIALLQTTHAAVGVEKGLRSANAMPVEVMGFLHGHISTEEPGVYVITDVRGTAALAKRVARGLSRIHLAGSLRVLTYFGLFWLGSRAGLPVACGGYRNYGSCRLT